jgi:hypothetical protein
MGRSYLDNTVAKWFTSDISNGSMNFNLEMQD